MMTENNRLPDVLRPTELHDFSDMFTAGKAHGGPAKAVLVIATVAALIHGVLQVAGTASGPSSPAAVIAAR